LRRWRCSWTTTSGAVGGRGGGSARGCHPAAPASPGPPARTARGRGGPQRACPPGRPPRGAGGGHRGAERAGACAGQGSSLKMTAVAAMFRVAPGPGSVANAPVLASPSARPEGGRPRGHGGPAAGAAARGRGGGLPPRRQDGRPAPGGDRRRAGVRPDGDGDAGGRGGGGGAPGAGLRAPGRPRRPARLLAGYICSY
ncbi:unnamed protein product, partial [Heterosigma akashiwo]